MKKISRILVILMAIAIMFSMSACCSDTSKISVLRITVEDYRTFASAENYGWSAEDGAEFHEAVTENTLLLRFD